MAQPSGEPVTALVLTGGGARAAYQAGVLRALVQIRREVGAGGRNPFPVIVGTSAGAINAAALATGVDRFDAAVAALVDVWEGLHAEQVYRADSLGVIRSGARWLTMLSLGWALTRWRRVRPRSLLDNEPLESLLARWIALDRLGDLLRAGHLQALAVSASSYSSGQHVTFYQSARPLAPWARTQRVAVQAPIGHSHLLASSALPFLFPASAVMLDGQLEYFGDGSMRQTAPISPAVHLGAERVLVIGAGRLQEPAARRAGTNGYPSLAQIAGHALSSIFLDALAADVERLQRVNQTLSLLDAEARAQTSLRPIDVLVIAPSQRLDDLAGQHVDSLPAPIRALLGGVGVDTRGGRDARGSALASYLLFEPPYTRALVRLGVADTLARRADVLRFFGWGESPASRAPARHRAQAGA